MTATSCRDVANAVWPLRLFVWHCSVRIPGNAKCVTSVSGIVAVLARCAVAELKGSILALYGRLNSLGLPNAQFTARVSAGALKL